jgi:hypothetical protein
VHGLQSLHRHWKTSRTLAEDQEDSAHDPQNGNAESHMTDKCGIKVEHPELPGVPEAVEKIGTGLYSMIPG